MAATTGFTVERAIVVDDQMRTVEDPDVYAVGECVQHRGEVYGLVAPLWEQAVVLADHDHRGRTRTPQYLGSRTATKLKVAGVEVASMGVSEPERETDEHIVFSEPSRASTSRVVMRDGKVIGATLLGDSKKVAFLQQAFDRGLPLPEERAELLFDLGGPSEEVGVAEMADDAQVCNCNGVCKGTIVDTRQGRLQDRHRRDGQDPGRQGLRLLQGSGRPARRVRGRRGGGGGPVGPLLRAGHPDGQAEADDRDPRPRSALGRRRCSRRWRPTAPRTRSPRWAWRRC